MSASKKVRTAVIGLRMGRAHAHAFKRADGADLRWVIDLDESLAEEVAGEVGCAWTTNYEEILDDVDAVSVCLPHHLHAPVSLKLLEAGKHVLVEKPMANTEEECLAMIEAAEKNDRKLMVAFPLRYRPEYRALKQVIDSGQFGDVITANGFVHSYLTPVPNTWFARKDQLGGGVLFSHGCHDIDVMIWLFGMPTEAHYVATRVGTDWMEGEGTAQCVFAFDKGIIGNLSVSWGLQFKQQPSRIQVHTTDAMIATKGGRLIVIDEDGERTLFERPADTERHVGLGVMDEIEHFIDCIVRNRTPMTDGHEGMKSLKVVWDMYASKKNGVS